MNCDDAFELMTDPQARDSGALRAHLAACPRCRQMCETLAPALEWLARGPDAPLVETPRRPAQAPVSPRAKPWSLKSETMARQSAARLSLRARPGRARLRQVVAALSRGAALLLAGFALGVILFPGTKRLARTDDARCTRREAASKSGRDEAEIRSLIANCSTCHVTPVRPETTLRLAPRRQPADKLLIVLAEQFASGPSPYAANRSTILDFGRA